MLASYVTLYFVPLKISPTGRSLEGADGSWTALLHGAQSCFLWAAAKSKLSNLPSRKAVRVY